ncbi:hypothetical protein AB0F30_23370 [Streptomyces sp. NPDC029006]|uniref:hypothetical protein n=1 Tax=Streptomyces sp. NPDC029006 TaxID=3155467 RepID=UPI0033C87F06
MTRCWPTARRHCPSSSADVNDRIRHLMGQPVTMDRTQQYHESLAEWHDLAADDIEPAV